jgi:hypothetical protein
LVGREFLNLQITIKVEAHGGCVVEWNPWGSSQFVDEFAQPFQLIRGGREVV